MKCKEPDSAESGSFRMRSSDQIALEAVEVFGLDDAFEVEAVFTVLLELDAARSRMGAARPSLS